MKRLGYFKGKKHLNERNPNACCDTCSGEPVTSTDRHFFTSHRNGKNYMANKNRGQGHRQYKDGKLRYIVELLIVVDYALYKGSVMYQLLRSLAYFCLNPSKMLNTLNLGRTCSLTDTNDELTLKQ